MKDLTYTLGRDFVRDDRALFDDDGQIDPLSLDLLDLATTAYLLDRKEKRGPAHSPSWHRSLVLRCGVRRPAVWRRREVRSALLDLLHWLTEDDWSFEVLPASHQDQPGQMALSLDEPDREVVLFSGGLDSTAGAAIQLEAGTPLVGVPVWTNLTMKGYQQRTARALAAVEDWDFISAPINLSSRSAQSHDEPTRRTRGLVFLVAGWSVASARGRNRLHVLENGIGAINLPCTAAQRGCMLSRSVHPHTLRLAARLFSLVRDEPFEVINPHLTETKGQMLAHVPDRGRVACGASESCDLAAAGRGRAKRRCGTCSSCLLRRVAFSAAGRREWDDRPYLDDESVSSAHLPEVLWQVGRLEDALASSDPAAALLEAFPQLRDVPRSEASSKELVDLYSAYLREWTIYPHPLVGRFLRGGAVAA